MAKLLANNGDLDQMPRSAASDLGLPCLPFIRLGVSSLQWTEYCGTSTILVLKFEHPLYVTNWCV